MSAADPDEWLWDQGRQEWFHRTTGAWYDTDGNLVAVGVATPQRSSEERELLDELLDGVGLEPPVKELSSRMVGLLAVVAVLGIAVGVYASITVDDDLLCTAPGAEQLNPDRC